MREPAGSGLGVAIGVGLLTAVVGAGVNLLTAPVDGGWTSRWWVWITVGVLVAVIAVAYLQRRPGRAVVVRAVAASDTGHGTMEVLVATTTGAVLATEMHEEGTWEPWTRSPGQAWDVAVVQPSLDVVEHYVADRDGALRGRRRDHGVWSGWRPVPSPPARHARVVRLAAASLKPGHRELYVVMDDGRLMHSWKWDDSSTWSEWYDAGLSGMIDVAVCSPKDGLLEHFAIGRDGDVWHRWYWDEWSPWENWGRPGSPAKAITAYRRADDKQEVFATGKAGDLVHRWHTGGEPWSGWAVMETPQDFQDLAAGTTSSSRLWCLAVDRNGHLWQRSFHRRWDPQWKRVGA